MQWNSDSGKVKNINADNFLRGETMKKTLLMSLLLVIPFCIFGQTGDAEIANIEKDTDCQHIDVTVCVYDSNGWYMPDLILSDFNFSENGFPVVPPDITLINSCEGGCVDIAMLMDFSGSMDDDVDAFHAALSVFSGGLDAVGVDYRICMTVFNGCPEDLLRDGVRKLIHTDFTAPPPCTIGTDIWASDETEFSRLFAALQEYYDLPLSVRGSGWEDQWGTTYWAIDTLDWRPGCRKAVVLFTDEEVQVESSPCDPYLDYSDSCLYWMMNYCWDESVTFFGVSPPDSDMQWYPPGDSPSRAVYAGYRVLAESTDGIWSNLYDTLYNDMIASLAEAIANIPCCYDFRYQTSQYCVDPLNLNVDVVLGTEYIGSDDSIYTAFCPPQIDILMPDPPGGITSCADQSIMAWHSNRFFGDLVNSTLVLDIEGDTFHIADPEITVIGDTIIHNPPVNYAHMDTVIFSFTYYENQWGCAGVTPPCTFYVDIEPPAVIDRYPAPGDTLFVGFVNISGDIFDDYSGIDTSSVPGNISVCMGSDTLATAPPLWIAGDTTNVTIDSIIAYRDGLVTVCIEDIYDSPDYSYCPPNQMSPDCWDFYIFTVEREVGFPVQYGYPCDTVLIPLSVDDLAYTSLHSAEMFFHVDPEVLVPLDIITTGSLTDTWSVDSLWINETSGEIFSKISGSPLGGSGGGNFLFLKARVPCSAYGGQFTPVVIDSFAFNEGFPRVNWTAGFFIVELRPMHFSCDLRFNRTTVQAPEDFVITFGANYTASGDFDPGVDIQHVPPPAFMVNAWFPLDDPAYTYITRLQRDMRYPSPPLEWDVYTYDEPDGVMRWDPNALPEGEFRIDGIVDMKRDSIAYFGLNDTMVIRWYLPALAPNNINYTTGWNMVSSPVLPTEVPASEIFPSDVGVFKYLTDLRTYNYADLIRDGEGYWIWSESETSFTIAGSGIPGYRREILPGWNLIGAIENSASVSDIEISPSGGILGDIFGWDGVTYYSADSLKPGRAYWLLSTSSGILHVPSGYRSRPGITPQPLWEITALIETGTENNTVIMAYSPDAASGLGFGDIPMPPVPPTENQRQSALLCDGIELALDQSPSAEWQLLLKENAFITLTYPEDKFVSIDGEKYLSGEKFSLSPGLHRITADNILPEHFSILGCVPNPFNAATDILIAMPEKSELHLDIFDISGRLVNSISGEYPAGTIKISWDGRKSTGKELPSGMYLVRAKCGDNTAFSRTMLIK